MSLGEPVDLWEYGNQLEGKEVVLQVDTEMSMIRQIKIVPFIKATIKGNGERGGGRHGPA